DLEPVHPRPLLEDVAEVDGPQADADAEVGEVPAIAQARSLPSGAMRTRRGRRESLLPLPTMKGRSTLPALAAALALAGALAGLLLLFLDGRGHVGLHRHPAAALALAGVLARAAVVPARAAALALALVLALAVVLGRCRAAALALAGVLAVRTL